MLASIEEAEKERRYKSACNDFDLLVNNKVNNATIGSVASKVYSTFKSLSDYKDSAEKLNVIKKLLDQHREYENEQKGKLQELKNEVEKYERLLVEFKKKNRKNFGIIPDAAVAMKVGKFTGKVISNVLLSVSFADVCGISFNTGLPS